MVFFSISTPCIAYRLLPNSASWCCLMRGSGKREPFRKHDKTSATYSSHAFHFCDLLELFWGSSHIFLGFQMFSFPLPHNPQVQKGSRWLSVQKDPLWPGSTAAPLRGGALLSTGRRENNFTSLSTVKVGCCLQRYAKKSIYFSWSF